VSQHERRPLQGSSVGTHWFSRSQRCVVGSHPPSQQSAFFSQMSPPARQKLKNEQRPERQRPEQQLPLLEHDSPRMAHDWFGSTHLPLAQSLPQHAVLEVHEPPATVHFEAVEHVFASGSQKSEQHSLDSAQVAPADLHSFGPLHRFTPSTS
jgi:hypothetical protein